MRDGPLWTQKQRGEGSHKKDTVRSGALRGKGRKEGKEGGIPYLGDLHGGLFF